MNNKPIKLIRDRKAERLLLEGKLKPEEISFISDKQEYKKLLVLKIKEELEEVVNSNCSDEGEFADLWTAIFDLMEASKMDQEKVLLLLRNKALVDGCFDGTILTNLNPNNPSNKLYFNQPQE